MYIIMICLVMCVNNGLLFKTFKFTLAPVTHSCCTYVPEFSAVCLIILHG